jgi:hemoglobin/transferrin/lactoferrin receptor protein
MLNKTILMLLFLFLGTNLFSQTYTIDGNVLEENTHVFLKNVLLINLDIGDTTEVDEFGHFSIVVPKRASYNLKIECLGYHSQTINVDINNVNEANQEAIITTIYLLPNFEKSFNHQLNAAISSTVSKNNLLQNAAPTLPDALSQTSGIWLSRPSYMNNALSIRGLVGNRNRIFINDIPLNHSIMESSPDILLNMIGICDVDNIQIIKGGNTTRYGDGSLGGVIQVNTPEPEVFNGKFNLEGFGQVRLSNSREFLSHGGITLATENFALRYTLFTQSIGNIGEQSPTGYRQLGGNLHGVAFIGRSKFEFGVNSLGMRSRNDDQPTNIDTSFLHLSPTLVDRTLGYVKYQHIARKGPFRIIQAKFAYQGLNNTNLEFLSDTSISSLEIKNNRFWLNLTGTTNIKDDWKMLTGIEIEQEGLNISNILRNSSEIITLPYTGSYLTSTDYGKASFYNIHTIIKGKWDFEIGVRGTWANLQGYASSNLMQIQVQPLSVAGNINANYQINTNQRIKGSVNHNYRTPNFSDFLNITDATPIRVIANENLVGEKSLNFELAYQLATNRLNGQLALYRSQIYDAIELIPVSLISISQNQNIGNGYVQGVEIDASFLLSSNFNISGNLSYTFGQDVYRNQPMRYMPPIHGVVHLKYQSNDKNLTSSLTYQFAGTQSRYAPENPWAGLEAEIPVDAWHILNFSIGYRWKELNINGGIRNILNESYQLYGSPISEYNRNLWIGLRYN